jgi:GNAT superfamily N-acetyltransferase
VTIRKLEAGDDGTAAIDLLCRFFAEEDFPTETNVIAAHVHQMLELETCGLFLAEERGKAVGVATVSLEFGIEYGWWAEMGDLYVLPQYRGKGHSRALVAAAETFLKKHGAVGYQVTVTPYAQDHHNLKDFYDALGFETEGRVILRKNLR